MNKQELKPCPFCGGESFDDTWPDDFGVLSGSIACDCGARGIELDCDNKTKGELIDHWNTRPVEDELRQENEQLKANLEASQESLKEYMQACSRQAKRIGELVEQIEKMKCCKNCKHSQQDKCGHPDFEKYYKCLTDNLKHWELKESEA